jgi:ADP-heptose:LPS heptosyltransferase
MTTRRPTMMHKTFIHHDGALGDLLLSLPAIARLREKSGFVHLAAASDVVELLIEAGMIDEGSAAGSACYVSLYGDEVTPVMREFLSGFDSAFLFSTRADSALLRNIASIVAETRAILTIPPQGVQHHVAGFRLRQLPDYAGASATIRLSLTSERLEQARSFLCLSGHDFARPLISVHPGSGGARKCWPMGSYCALFEILRERCNPFLLLFSGPAEDETITRILQRFTDNNPRRSAHVRNSGLAAVSALLSMSDLYIGNDSGISHLAASLGTRSMAFFGPTDPLLWKPLGENVRIVKSEVECAPCADDKSRGCRERRCLASVSPDRLYREARRVLPDVLCRE